MNGRMPVQDVNNNVFSTHVESWQAFRAFSVERIATAICV
jgi:hypothetical protein